MASYCLKQPTLIYSLMQCARTMKPPPFPLISGMKVHKRQLHSNTIDPIDQVHLKKFAKDWWNPEGPIKPLHTFNVIRVPLIRDSLITLTPETPQSTCLRGKKILEVGCGPGLLSEDLAKLGAEVTGIDTSKELLDAAVEHSKLNTNLTNKPTYIYTAIEDYIKNHSDEYDAVVASEVIEHVNHTEREFFIQSCVKALKPGGKIIFTTPNRTRMSQLLGIYFVEGFGIVPKGTHQYHKFSTQDELKYWLELNDCRVDLTQGYAYYFWSHTWKWIKWQSLAYAMRAVKLDKKT